MPVTPEAPDQVEMARLVHDLRQPLSTLMLLADNLQHVDLHGDAAAIAEEIARQVGEAVAIARQINRLVE